MFDLTVLFETVLFEIFLEELFTLCPDEAIRHSFLDLLFGVFKSPPSNLEIPPVLITTMRADFLGNALSYSPLADVLKSDIQLIGAMNREHLSAVIIKPAAMLGVGFESGLVDRILNDVMDEPGNLALLEFTLTELWQKRASNQLTHQAYDAIGQVKGALANYAESEYQKLGDQEKKQARQIFLQLVNPGEDNNDTRRRVNRQQFGENNWDLVTRKGGLADSRLVVTSFDSHEQETLEVVHEALILHWQRLGQWLEENRDDLRQKIKLDAAAQEWVLSEKNDDYLLQGAKLIEAESYFNNEQKLVMLDEVAAEFITASQNFRTEQEQEQKRQRKEKLANLEARRKAEESAKIAAEKAQQEAEQRESEQRQANEKLRLLSALAVTVGIVASILGIHSYFNSQKAELKQTASYIKVKLVLGNEVERLLESIELAGENQKLNQRSFNLSNRLLPEVQSILYQAVQDSRERFSFNGHQDSVNSMGFSPDGNYLVSGSLDKTVKLWRVKDWQDWLEIGCERIRLHPVLVSGETELAINAANTCLKYGRWSDEEKAEFFESKKD